MQSLSLSRFLAVAAVILSTLSCSESTPPPTPTSLAFSSDAVNLLADDSAPIGATLTMSDGSTTGTSSLVSYSTSAPNIATVSSKGVVTALAAGVATISAQAGTLHDELVVTVTWAPITTIAFGRDTATLLLDDSLSTTVAVTNSHTKPAPNAVVTYSTTAPNIATVDATGRIRTLATGSATITATAESVHADINVTVVPHFTQFAPGAEHVCGIAGTGFTYCWGADINGSLGSGWTTPNCPQIGGHCSPVPVRVTGSQRFVAITAGEFHTCALTSGGTAYCWGGNYFGQVGTGTLGGEVTLPTPVAGGLTFTSIRAGRMHTCGIVTSGDTYCWGWDNQAQLGAGATAAGRCTFFGANEPCSGTPLKVAGNLRFVEVNASDRNSCGRDAAGAIYCWGFAIGGTDPTDCQGSDPACTRTPLLQVGGATFPKFGMGNVYRCGQKADGVISCWGADNYGCFGNGGTVTSDTLIRAAGGKSYAQAAFGRLHVCGLNSGSVECWGSGYYGQVGGARGVDRSTPGSVSGGVTFASITSGPNSDLNCGISTAGRAYCWGNGELGQLGNGTLGTLASSAEPVLVKLVR